MKKTFTKRKKEPEILGDSKKTPYLCIAFEKQSDMVVVVQLVRASDCGSECRGFESHQPPTKLDSSKFCCYFLFYKFVASTWEAGAFTVEQELAKQQGENKARTLIYNKQPPPKRRFGGSCYYMLFENDIAAGVLHRVNRHTVSLFLKIVQHHAIPLAE